MTAKENSSTVNSKRIDVSKPRWDQNTFLGRLKHFANVTDPRTIFVSERTLYDAKHLLELYSAGGPLAAVKLEDIYYAQKLCMSAFHPDTGELQNVVGRMSCQVPCGMALIGAMMTWYRTTTAVIFWQWLNQSFNALVNYTNRNAKSSITTTQMLVAYSSATGSALVAAIGLKNYLATRASPLMLRFVPFVAVAAANCANIPLMRQSELANGILLVDENDSDVCQSRLAAAKAIGLVVTSRIAIVTPPMLVVPVIMERMETLRWFARRRTMLNAPIQTLLSGFFLLLMVPFGCALFPQKNYIFLSTLQRWEPKAFEAYAAKASSNVDGKVNDKLYFNKGL